MGSDYQRVKVLEVSGASVVLEVTERHPDMDAIHLILTKKGAEYAAASLAAPLTSLAIPRGKAGWARNFAAQLLADYGESPFYEAAEEYAEAEESDPDPDAFIAEVTVRAIAPLDKASNKCWLYRATLAIELKDPALAAGFKPRRTYAGRACPTGDWELL